MTSVVLLTRDTHAGGRWLLDLQQSLQKRGAEVKILKLSEFDGNMIRCDVLVNRVSDAAPLADVKMCLAILRAYDLHGVKVINGYDCFTVGMSKMLHYSLFKRAGVSTPKYCVIRSGERIEDAVSNHSLKFPLLLKPNSGGFGKGIVRLDDAESLKGDFSETFGEEKIAISQEYIEARDGFIYRVWFMGGRVHRAVQVRLDGKQEGDFNACVCSVSFEKFDCPSDIQESIITLAGLSKADCGSVEYLYDAEGTVQFFDFNLLSTLPDDSAYDELSDYILGR